MFGFITYVSVMRVNGADRERGRIGFGRRSCPILNEPIRLGLAVRLVSGDSEAVNAGGGSASESLARVGPIAPLTGSSKNRGDDQKGGGQELGAEEHSGGE